MATSEDTDLVLRALLGRHHAQASGWLYVQEQDRDGLVSFVGGSRLPKGAAAGAHPFRFGSARTHQFVVGDLIMRPGLVVATDTLRGHGLTGLAMSGHDVPAMLRDGEGLIDPAGVLRGL